MAQEILPAAEFQSLPLEFIISAPLMGVIKSQAIAAQATLEFINTFKDQTVEFENTIDTTTAGAASQQKVSIKAPLLTMVPIPHIRIDSFTTHFKYEISQAVTEKKSCDMGVSLDAGSTGILSKFVNASIKGNVSSQSSSESTMNRSGVLEITLHASEAPIPEGLARILNLLAKTIPVDSNDVAK
jgi:hypothetical protein